MSSMVKRISKRFVGIVTVRWDRIAQGLANRIVQDVLLLGRRGVALQQELDTRQAGETAVDVQRRNQ